MSTASDIEETLRHVAETVDVPRPDETAFRRRVRRERTRVMAVRTMAVGAAAAVVVTGASFASLWAGPDSAGDPGGEAPVAGPPKGVVAQDRPPVYLSVDGRLSALDPLGELHDLGVGVEEIVGATPDGVLAVCRESHLVRFRAVEGDAGWRFERLDPPVEEAVQRAAVSSASGLVAWLSMDDELMAYDLKAERRAEEVRVSSGAAVLDVGTACCSPMATRCFSPAGTERRQSRGSSACPGPPPPAARSWHSREARPRRHPAVRGLREQRQAGGRAPGGGGAVSPDVTTWPSRVRRKGRTAGSCSGEVT